MGNRRTMAALAALAVVVATLASAEGRAGAEAVVARFKVAPATAGLHGIAHGPDGNLWVTERSSSAVTRVRPDGAATRYALPDGRTPHDIAAGPDGHLWFTQTSADRVGRMATDGRLVADVKLPNGARPTGIAAGPDGNLWVVESGTNSVLRLSPTGAGVRFPIGSGSNPDGIAPGPDGALWVTETTGNGVARVTTAGLVTRFPVVSNPAAGLDGVTTGPDGALWVTQANKDRLLRTTTAGHMTEVALGGAVSTKVRPDQIVTGPDDALWVTAVDAGAVLRYDPAGGSLTALHLHPDAGPRGIAVGPGLDLWVVEGGTGHVARIRPPAKRPSVSAARLTVAPATAPAGRQVTPSANLAPGTLSDTAALQATPLFGSKLLEPPLQGTPLFGSRIGGLPLFGSRIGGLPLYGSKLLGLPLFGSKLLGLPLTVPPIPLSAVGLRDRTWDEVLAGTPFEGVPHSAVLLQDVLALDPRPPAVEGLSLADVDLSNTWLRDAPLAAVLAGDSTLRQVPAPPEGWCAFLAGRRPGCTDADLDRWTLLTLHLEEVDLGAYYARQLPLGGFAALPATPLGQALVAPLGLAQTSLGSLPSTSVQPILRCSGAECPATLAEAQAAGLIRPDATVAQLAVLLPGTAAAAIGLGELLAAFVPHYDLPVESGDVPDVLDKALVRPGDLLRYTASFDLRCDQASGLQVVLSLPARFRARPGTSTVRPAAGPAVPIADPAVDGDQLTLTASGDQAGCTGSPPLSSRSVEVSTEVEPGEVLGVYASSVAVSTALDRSADLPPAAASASPVGVDDGHDPAGSAADARPIATETVYAGHISRAGDVDTYHLPAPPAGALLTVTVSNLPFDADLVVFGGDPSVPATPARAAGRPVTAGGIGIGDDVNQLGISDSNLSPNLLDDVPLQEGLTVRAASAKRGTEAESVTLAVHDSDAAAGFAVQVTGFGGVTSTRPYLLRATVRMGAAAHPCRPTSWVEPDAPPGTAPTLPLPAGTRTLVLVNEQRFRRIHGSAAALPVLDDLRAWAAANDAEVLAVESDPDVAAAYAALDADPCANPNVAVSRINQLVDRARVGLHQLRSIVIAGDDRVVPFAWQPDLTQLYNERHHEASVGGLDSRTSRALRHGMVLTDDPYGDLDPRPWLGGTLYVPDLAVGRLVESPAEIAGQLAQHRASGGRLAPTSAAVLGYDFITDGTEAVADGLRPLLPTTVRTDQWTAADAADAIASGPAVVSVNGHYDQTSALPARTFAAGGADLLHADETSPVAGSLLFTMGCHAGLNVPDVAVAAPGPSRRDWAQVTSGAGAIYAANTGFGYGDADVVAYSERYFATFARLVGTGAYTVGQAHQAAKHEYLAEVGLPSVYDAKVMVQATFYGIPTYRVGPGGGEAPAPAGVGSPSTPAPLSAGTAVEAPLVSVPLHVEPGARPVQTGRGTYWAVPGHAPMVSPHRPVQPRVGIDVTQPDGTPVHGFLVEHVVTTDVTGVDLVFQRPVVDLAASEPERTARTAHFPADLPTIQESAPAGARRDTLDLAVGQALVEPGQPARQRLYTSVSGVVLASRSDDWTPPTVAEVGGGVVGSNATVWVRTPDSDTVRGVVLFRDDTSEVWRRAELLHLGGGTWSVGIALGPGATRLRDVRVQLQDGAGNVGRSTNKGTGYGVGAIGGTGPLGVALDPPPGPSGYGTGPTTATVVGLVDGEGASYSVDGGPARRYTGPFVVDGDGLHVVRVTADGGAQATAAVGIDTTAPVVTSTASPPPNAEGWNRTEVVVSFTCNDGVSGVATCPPSVVLSAEGRHPGVTRSAYDRTGHRTDHTGGPVWIDRTAPTTSIDSAVGPVVQVGGPVSGRAADALSGPRTAEVSFTDATTGASTVVVVPVDPSGGWSAAAPAPGAYRVTARSTDGAGNRDPVGATTLLTVTA